MPTTILTVIGDGVVVRDVPQCCRAHKQEQCRRQRHPIHYVLALPAGTEKRGIHYYTQTQSIVHLQVLTSVQRH